MTKYYKNPPPPENYTKPKPPPCPPTPPSREFICNMFGFTESKESISKLKEWQENNKLDKGSTMNELRNKLTALINRKDELTDWLNEVSVEIEKAKTEIAKEEKLIRHCDFIVTIDPPSGTLVVKTGTGCLVTHRLTGMYEYCNDFNAVHINKNQAYTILIESLKKGGWKSEE